MHLPNCTLARNQKKLCAISSILHEKFPWLFLFVYHCTKCTKYEPCAKCRKYTKYETCAKCTGFIFSTFPVVVHLKKTLKHKSFFTFQSQFNVQKSETAKTRPQQSSHISSTKSSDDWGWGNEEDLSVQTNTNTSVKPHKGALKLGGPKKAPVEDFGWIEEEFAPIEDSSVEPASSYNWGQMDDNTGGDDFFSMAGGITSQVCILASR